MPMRAALLAALLALPRASAADPPPLAMTAADLSTLIRSPLPAFVAFHPVGCAAACASRLAVWQSLAARLRGVRVALGVVECADEPEACASRKVSPSDAPVLKFWTGKTFRRYTGPLELRQLEEYAAAKLAELPDATKAELGFAPAAAGGGAAPLGAAEMVQLRLALLALGAGLAGAWLLVRWLALPWREEGATMLLVGSRQHPTERVPARGAGEGFYVFRMCGSSGEMVPVAQMVVEAPNIACMLAARGQERGRGYLLHVVCEMDRESKLGKGGVASVRFDASTSPCLADSGGVELSCGLTCALCSLDAISPGPGKGNFAERYVAAAYDGSLAVLKPERKQPRWTRPSTWRSPLTGALELDFSFHAGEATSSGASASAVASVLVSHATARSRYVAVADPRRGQLHVCRVLVDESAATTIGSVAMPPGAHPAVLAVHPSEGIVYVLCEEGILAFVEVSHSSPPRLLSHLSLAANSTSPRPTGEEAEAAAYTPPALVLTRDTNFLYAVCGEARGAILALSLTADGKAASVLARTPLDPSADACVAAAGLGLVGRREELLVAACPAAHRLLSFRRDVGSGKLTRADEVQCPSPYTLLPLGWPPA
ncbi:hypothetical protein AB1Y20_015554 [Prymnesium parvum]|uniref:Uncharacterized protein n=1 Tax=Prymnesium parvum TaxID=97485 RepID=A0AB34JXI1_PRYPA